MIFAREARKLANDAWNEKYNEAFMCKLLDIESRIKDACEIPTTSLMVDIDGKLVEEVYKSLNSFGYKVKLQEIFRALRGDIYKTEISWDQSE